MWALPHNKALLWCYELWRAHAVPAAGYLVSTDAYMNLQLANTEEFIDGTFTGNLGEVLIRCVCRGLASPQLCSVRIATTWYNAAQHEMLAEATKD